MPGIGYQNFACLLRDFYQKMGGNNFSSTDFFLSAFFHRAYGMIVSILIDFLQIRTN
jgi:hypothetical protein